ELPLAGVEAGVAAPFGEDAVAPPVRPCPPPSTYAVAVIVPVSRLEGAVDPDAGTGASFALWIVSRRPLTCRPPEAVRTVALFSFKKRRYRSANVPSKVNVNGSCENPAGAEPAPAAAVPAEAELVALVPAAGELDAGEPDAAPVPTTIEAKLTSRRWEAWASW